MWSATAPAGEAIYCRRTRKGIRCGACQMTKGIAAPFSTPGSRRQDVARHGYKSWVVSVAERTPALISSRLPPRRPRWAPNSPSHRFLLTPSSYQACVSLLWPINALPKRTGNCPATRLRAVCELDRDFCGPLSVNFYRLRFHPGYSVSGKTMAVSRRRPHDGHTKPTEPSSIW